MKQVLTYCIVSITLLFAVSNIVYGQSATNKDGLITGPDTLFVCQGQGIELGLNAEAENIVWSPNGFFNDRTLPNPLATPITSREVTISATLDGQEVRDTVFLQLVVTPTLAPDSQDELTICRGEIVTLSANSNTNGQGLSWEANLDDANINSIPNEADQVTVQPSFTTRFTANIDLQGCTASEDITVTVLPPRVDITNPDTIETCLGDEAVTLTATTSIGTADGLSWSPNLGGLSSTTGLQVSVNPKVTTTYYTTFVNDGCTITDSVTVRVDSLPDLTLTADPAKEVYCQGDLVTLSSPTFETSLYPDITHMWTMGEGQETPDTLWNMVFTANDTTTFVRITENHACIDSVSLFVPVIKPKDITITPEQPIICPGESVQLEASFEGDYDEIMWEPADDGTLSCTDCLDPTAAPFATTNYTITVTEKECPSSASRTVEVLPNPAVELVGESERQICRGESLQLNFANDGQSSYVWTSPDIPGFSSTEPLLVVTPDETTTYTLTVQFGECDPFTASLTIDVVQPATLSVSDDQTICPGEPLTLTATGSAPAGVSENFIWQWVGNEEVAPEITVNNLTQTTTFRVIYTYGPGCGPLTENVTVQVVDVPEIAGFEILPENATTAGIPQGEDVQVGVILAPDNANGLTFNWTANGAPISGNGQTITHQPAENPTVYAVTIESQEGCAIEGTAPPVRVLEPQHKVPNAFTPNGDGNNDFFNVVSVGNIEIAAFQVWNRWGQLVYDNEDPANGWDGTKDGEPAPSEVYVYRIVINYPNGQEFVEQGDVTLIR